MNENQTDRLEADIRDIKATLVRLEVLLKKKPGRLVIWTALGLLLGIQAIPAAVFTLISAFYHPAHGAEQHNVPYSCQLLYGEQKKCAFDPHCDKRVVERLTKECLRDGGRP